MSKRIWAVIGCIFFTAIWTLVLVAYGTNLDYGWAVVIRDSNWGILISFISLAGLLFCVAVATRDEFRRLYRG